MGDIKDFNIENGVLVKYNGEDTNVVIPDTVTSIGNSAFWGQNSKCITSIIIPDSVTSIGDHAFQYCDSLVSINIPNSVTNIGFSAFYGCAELTSLTVPDSVTSINHSTFAECRSLVSITIPDSVTSIGDHAFQYCDSLTSITIPDSVTSIGSFMFSGCANLTSIIIPDSVTSIGGSMFSGCGNLTSVTIPDSVTSIGGSAFDGCRNLTSITIPDSVTSIGGSAFDGCRNLTSITIPDSVKELNYKTFSGCKSLKEVDIRNKNIVINETVFEYCEVENFIAQLIDSGVSFTANAVKEYMLKNTARWHNVPDKQKVDFFFNYRTKTMEKLYLDRTNGNVAAAMADIIISMPWDEASPKEFKNISAFMELFVDILSEDHVSKLYDILGSYKKAAKVKENIDKNAAVKNKLGKKVEIPEDTPELERRYLTDINNPINKIEYDLNNFYSITTDALPCIKYKDGRTAQPFVLARLLTIHEELVQFNTKDVVALYNKPGLCPEAREILEYIDTSTFMEALGKLADRNLGLTGRSKKMFLAYPICRYADSALMTELTKHAPSWRSSVSGNDAPPLKTFRMANMYNDTHAAMLFAEKYHELDKYAELRGVSEDVLRDKYLSDVGLSADGTKVYDLGKVMARVRMQPDLSFAIETSDGKTPKSLPKKGADPDKYETANKDFTELKKNVKKIVKSRTDKLFEEFLGGQGKAGSEWKDSYFNNPLLLRVAKLLVWEQDGTTFTLTDTGAIRADGTEYVIRDKNSVCVAHPMDMNKGDISAWQKYFTTNGLKQPFEQIWEPVIDKNTIKADRYKGCMIPFYRFKGREKHGIEVEDYNFHNEIAIGFKHCQAFVERIDYQRHNIDMNHRFEVQKFGFRRYTRQVNHIVAYLDRITVYDRIAKDDVSVEHFLHGFTLAQISEFITIAGENDAVNVMALLLDYKNRNFADYDPMDEFVL